MDSSLSPDWRVSNLVPGTMVNLGTGTNTSDVGYNPFTKRFGFIRNNFGTVTEISESDIVNSVASPTLIRVVTINGLGGFNDTEGLTDVYQNLTEGGYEFWISIENGGRNWIYNVPFDVDDMFSTSNVSVTQRQELIFARNSTGTNDAAEGVAFNLTTQQLLACQEGAVDIRRLFLMNRPTNRDTDYSYSNTGVHDGSNGDAVLTDTTKNWNVDEWISANISNETDSSSSTVTSNTATTITGVLSGGTENDWDIGDEYLVGDGNLIVTEPFDADTVVPSGSELASCVFHPPTGHMLLLSDSGNSVYQYTFDGTLIDTLDISALGFSNAEGLCMHGDNLVVMGEVDECVYFTYTVS
ncbi:MAG: hypothetical protein K0U78_15350 [Actinomycetia bacterium]|nr:hypothetical protein [Actinomycetes bacterium]